MTAATTTALKLTAETRVAELAMLQDKRIRVTKPHGKTVTGDLSYATHRPNGGGVRFHWKHDEYPSFAPYGSTVEITEATR